jgi:hypothetical protein
MRWGVLLEPSRVLYQLIRVLIVCSHRYDTVPDELRVRGRDMKFGIGQPMRRHEDLRLITGRGRYTDDVIRPAMTHAFVLRSPVAHAHIKRIDAAAARRMPGVLFSGNRRGRSGRRSRRRALHGSVGQS